MPMVEQGLLVEWIDISSEQSLLELYDWRIPVLRRLDNGDELAWPFEAAQIVAFLR